MHQLTITLYVKKGSHANGMTLKEYADSVIAGNDSFLSHAEFFEHFRASDSDMAIVTAWAQTNDLIIENSNQDIGTIKLTGDAEQWNTLFSISLIRDHRTIVDNSGNLIAIEDIYRHDEELVIPDSIVNSVDYVVGLDTEVACKPHIVLPDAIDTSLPAAGTVALTPQQVATAYNFPTGTGYGGCIGIIELGGGSATPGGFTTQNLNSTFNTIQGLSYVPNVVFVSVDGGLNQPDGESSTEYMLDIAICGGICPKATIAVYGAPNTGQGFIDCVTQAIYDTVNNPSVLSISWGLNETSSSSFRAGLDSAFQAAAILGISVFVSSGDFGSYVPSSNTYVLGIQYPGCSPYVTCTGGTTLTLSGSSISSEVVWNQNTAGSTGGISTVYTTLPSYQSGLTYKAYPSGTVSNLSVRGVPDVAANSATASGYNFYYKNNNTLYGPVGGTSAAAPLWAALICLLTVNSGRRFGFINTLLYSNPAVFRDITSGNNQCASSPVDATSGYSATVAWDACTGLGTPNGDLIYTLQNKGATYPKQNYGFRELSHSVYPRINTGAGRQNVITPILVGPSTLGTLTTGGGSSFSTIAVTFIASNGQGPYSYAVTSGSLPSGATLNAANGTISGVLTTVQTGNVTITATDSLGNTGNTGSISYSVVAYTGPLYNMITVSPSTSVTNNTIVTVNYNVANAVGIFAYTGVYYNNKQGDTPVAVASSYGTVTTNPQTYTNKFLATNVNLITYLPSIALAPTSTYPTFIGNSISVTATYTITPYTLGTLTQGTPATTTFVASGGTGPYTYSISYGALPSGMTLSGGVVSGTPTAGTYQSGSFVLTATDSLGVTASLYVPFTVSAAVTLKITAPIGMGMKASVAASYLMSASGGTAPYTFSIVGTLPTGLSVTGTTIVGTPTVVGLGSFTILSTDSVSNKGSLLIPYTVA